MKKIIWTDVAVEDLQNIHDYIAQDSLYYAEVLCAEIVLRVDQLLSFPKIGRSVPEYKDDLTREIIVNDYRVIYELVGNKINILVIIHGAKLLET